jgi:hypothetical protein
MTAPSYTRIPTHTDGRRVGFDDDAAEEGKMKGLSFEE